MKFGCPGIDFLAPLRMEEEMSLLETGKGKKKNKNENERKKMKIQRRDLMN